jgi:hypothetical protein
MSTLAAIPQAAPGPASPLVLLVVVEDGLNRFYQMVLTRAGYRCDRVRSPQELWASPPERLQAAHGVLVDHTADTLATLAEIRRRHPGVGTRVLSGYAPSPELGRTLMLPLPSGELTLAVAELVAEFRPV